MVILCSIYLCLFNDEMKQTYKKPSQNIKISKTNVQLNYGCSLTEGDNYILQLAH